MTISVLLLRFGGILRFRQLERNNEIFNHFLVVATSGFVLQTKRKCRKDGLQEVRCISSQSSICSQ